MEDSDRRDQSPDVQVGRQLALDGHGGALAGRVEHLNSLTHAERLEMRARYLGATVEEIQALDAAAGMSVVTGDVDVGVRLVSAIRFFENSSSDLPGDEKYVAWIRHAGSLGSMRSAKLEQDTLESMNLGPIDIDPIWGTQVLPDEAEIGRQREARQRQVDDGIAREKRKRKAEERRQRKVAEGQKRRDEKLRPPFETIDDIKFASLVWEDAPGGWSDQGWPAPKVDPNWDQQTAFGDETCDGVINGDIFIIVEWGDPYDPTVIMSTERWAISTMDMRRRASIPRLVYPGTPYFSVKRIRADRRIGTIGDQQQHRTHQAAVDAANAYVEARRAFDGEWSTDSDSCWRCGIQLSGDQDVLRGDHERSNVDGTRYFTEATCENCRA